jgi:regulator of RNase E activity RraA
MMDDQAANLSRRSFLGAGAALVATSAASAQETTPLAAPPQGVGVSTVADALRRVGRDPMALAMTTDIKALTSTRGTVFGPAVTTKYEAGKGRMTGEDVRKHMFEPLDAAAAGSIWVVAGGTDRILSLFGGVIGAACKRNGMVATVTDNGCRDIAAFEEIGFPVFAKASVPYGPGAYVKPVAANVPVVCGGVTVNPGDIVAADIDGVIVIPKDDYVAVMDAAAEVLAKEQKMHDKIAAGASLAETYKI